MSNDRLNNDQINKRGRYELVDFGGGRKLESVAGRLIDRPSPAAERAAVLEPEAWAAAESRFDRREKCWHHSSDWPCDLAVDCRHFQMPVQPTPFGHIGLFPEQRGNWDWLATGEAVDSGRARNSSRRQNSDRGQGPGPGDREGLAGPGLNLFGYTGASTLAMAATGMGVVHVDAARPNVQAARAAAELNGLKEHPIRYLVDDARKFVARELRRGRSYHTIVLDPPAYGHGTGGAAWRLQRDLWPLLDDCLKLVQPESFRLLITGHSAQIGEQDVLAYLRRTAPLKALFGSSALRSDIGRSQLKDRSGRTLDAGFFVRIAKLPAN